MKEDVSSADSREQLKLLAAAIYELRLLLSGYLGSEGEAEADVRLAAHLSYALHNEALRVLEGDCSFDIESARERVRRAEEIVGSRYSDGFGVLGVRRKGSPGLPASPDER